jgi:hypothetical protein
VKPMPRSSRKRGQNCNPLPSYMSYQAIGNYGIIGDMRTAALVGIDGGIDWYCYPHFDRRVSSPPSSTMRKAGASASDPARRRRLKASSSTGRRPMCSSRAFSAREGVGEVIDYMPLGAQATRASEHCLIRHVRCSRDG